MARKIFERAGRWPRPAPGLLTPGSRPPPRSSLVYSFAALNAFKSRAHFRNSTGSVGVGRTTALLPASALPKSSARPSDARPASATSRFSGVLLCCALCLHISRTFAEPNGSAGVGRWSRSWRQKAWRRSRSVASTLEDLSFRNAMLQFEARLSFFLHRRLTQSTLQKKFSSSA